LFLNESAFFHAFSQEFENEFKPINRDSFDLVYGSDPTVYNGLLFLNQNPSVKGTPFLGDGSFQKGNVILRGQCFANQELKFDVYNQKLIIKHVGKSGAVHFVVASDAWLEKFSLEEMNFERIQFPDGTYKIMQLIGTGNYRIGIHFTKKFAFNTSSNNSGYFYSDEIRTYYLINHEVCQAFWNKKSFFKLVGKEQQIPIRGYCNSRKINLRNPAYQTLEDLITYCNTLN
jgi:hypothetical protein